MSSLLSDWIVHRQDASNKDTQKARSYSSTEMPAVQTLNKEKNNTAGTMTKVIETDDYILDLVKKAVLIYLVHFWS